MAYDHSSGLPPQEAPVMMAEKLKLFLLVLGYVTHWGVNPDDWSQAVHVGLI